MVLGDRLFGRSLRLRLALWILNQQGASFYQGEAALGVSYSAGGVATDLDRLVELGMLIREEGAQDGRRQYYRQTASPFWKIIEAARNALADGASEAEATPPA